MQTLQLLQQAPQVHGHGMQGILLMQCATVFLPQAICRLACKQDGLCSYFATEVHYLATVLKHAAFQ